MLALRSTSMFLLFFFSKQIVYDIIKTGQIPRSAWSLSTIFSIYIQINTIYFDMISVSVVVSVSLSDFFFIFLQPQNPRCILMQIVGVNWIIWCQWSFFLLTFLSNLIAELIYWKVFCVFVRKWCVHDLRFNL